MTSLELGKECKAIAHVEGGAGVLCCYMADGHDGLHWDKTDVIWWSTEDPADSLDESQRFQTGDARLLLATWDRERGMDGGNYSTERALADAVRNLLGILDQLAKED
jgi:hypothetical protein